MRKINNSFLVAILLLLFSACTSKESKLIGKWAEDGNESSGSIEFFQDKTLTMQSEDLPFSGTWIILDDGRIKLEIDAIFMKMNAIGNFEGDDLILDLNGEETLNCLGLAGTQAAGLLESDHKGSMGKHLHAGRAAQSGILSALLAREGFTGADTILEGDEGFLNVMSSGYDIKDGLGHFHIRQVYMKKYPVCRHIHSTLDSASKILNSLKLKSVDEAMVDEVIVRTYKVAAEHDNYEPENMEFLRQSLPVSLALFLLNGDLRLEHLKDFKFARELAKKIRIETDRKLDSLYPEKRPSKVILKLKDENLEALTVLPSGEPENPLTRGNILKKFKMLNSEYDVKKLKILNEMESTPMDELMDELDLGGNKQ